MSISRPSRLCRMMIVLLALISARAAYAEPWGPWSTSTEAPAIFSARDRGPAHFTKSEPEPASVAATPFLWLISFYQNFLGRASRGRCPMYPTCSQYSIQAIRKHGPILGIVMTADRLMHEIDEKEYVPYVRVGSRYRFEDPVSNNDFWWYHE